MLVLCGGAFVVGVAASLAIPFVPFALALVLAIGVGAGWAGLHGIAVGQILLDALALLLATQVGYGLGLIGAAAAQTARQSLRRGSSTKSVPSALSDMHFGEKP